MATQEPINLTSFRSEARRTQDRGLEHQYRLAVGLIGALFLATACAVITIGKPETSEAGARAISAPTAAVMRTARG